MRISKKANCKLCENEFEVRNRSLTSVEAETLDVRMSMMAFMHMMKSHRNGKGIKVWILNTWYIISSIARTAILIIVHILYLILLIPVVIFDHFKDNL